MKTKNIKLFMQSTIFLFCFTLISCSVQKNDLAENDQAQEFQVEISSVRVIWPKAVNQAYLWHDNAYVRGVNIDLTSSKNGNIDTEFFFSFRSPDDDKAILSVKCSENNCSSTELETSISLPECVPITLDNFSIDSKEALNIGIIHGGKEYLFKDRSNNQLTLGSRCLEIEPTWRISFFDMNILEGVDFLIDANSGELISE